MAKADNRWQVIIGLCRYAGLGNTSETLSLKWSHIDWDRKRMFIPVSKLEHIEGREIRECPIFPDLLKILEYAYELNLSRDNPSEYVCDADSYRAAAQTAEGWKNSNLRTQFLKLLKKAGVEPWPRVFHSMRARLQTEFEEKFPRHVVCSWLGNTEEVFKEHYLLVTAEHFQKAAELAINPTQIPTQQGEKPCDKSDAAGSTQEASSPRKRQQKRRFSPVIASSRSGGQGIRTLNRFPGA